MTWRTWIIFWILCVCWGIPYFFIKLALVDFSPFCVAWSRITLAALVLAPIAWRRRVLSAALSKKSAVAAFAALEFVIPFSLVSIGERWISSSMTGVLIATAPLCVIVIAPSFGVREKITRQRLSGLFIGLLGVAVLLGVDNLTSANQWLGIACIFVAVAGYAVGPLVVERYLANVDSVGSLAASLIVASAVLLVPAAMTIPEHAPAALSLLSIAILGLISTALAMLLYFQLINEVGAARASVVAYVSPAIAAALGVLMLNERFSAASFVGMALILLGSWLGTGGTRDVAEPA